MQAASNGTPTRYYYFDLIHVARAHGAFIITAINGERLTLRDSRPLSQICERYWYSSTVEDEPARKVVRKTDVSGSAVVF